MKSKNLPPFFWRKLPFNAMHSCLKQVSKQTQEDKGKADTRIQWGIVSLWLLIHFWIQLHHRDNGPVCHSTFFLYASILWPWFWIFLSESPEQFCYFKHRAQLSPHLRSPPSVVCLSIFPREESWKPLMCILHKNGRIEWNLHIHSSARLGLKYHPSKSQFN